MLVGHFLCHRGAVVVINSQLPSTIFEIKLFADSNPARIVSEICDI